MKDLKPIWSDNYVVISATSSNEYVPYLSVYLESIKSNTDEKTNYDVVILEKSITNDNKKILKDFFEEKPNLSLRFYNPSELFLVSNLIVSHNYLCQESYYRLAAPLIFKNYKRLIFTDLDLIFNKNPKELFNKDMQGAPILSVLEPIWSNWINKNASVSSVNIIEYSQKILKLSDCHHYFNTGVMLMDIEQLNSRNISPQMIEKLSNGVKYLYQDQDVLNEMLASEMGILPWEWNNEILGSKTLDIANDFFKTYCDSNDKPGIIHWIGPNKPWKETTRQYAYLWWQYARKTPYYEIILLRMMNTSSINQQIQTLTDQIHDPLSFSKNILKYWRYKIMEKIMFGKKKEHYANKKQVWEEKIRIDKQLRGGK